MANKRGDKRSKPEYIITDGVRYVKPYVHEFKTFAKGRWLGRELLEVLLKEFGSHPRSYWEEAIRVGNVRVNGNAVLPNYIFKNSDSLLHRTHRWVHIVRWDCALLIRMSWVC